MKEIIKGLLVGIALALLTVLVLSIIGSFR